MQFIPEDEDGGLDNRTKFEAKLKSAYDFEEGRMLAKSWANLLGEEYELIPGLLITERRKLGESNRSMSATFPASIKHIIRGTSSIVTARSVRHYRCDFFNFINSLGFYKIYETDHNDGVTTLVVEFTG